MFEPGTGTEERGGGKMFELKLQSVLSILCSSSRTCSLIQTLWTNKCGRQSLSMIRKGRSPLFRKDTDKITDGSGLPVFPEHCVLQDDPI
ncbi:unnamed protein product [Fusarium graminearum]|nr:unnamed protein product [Fusarium graminearum]